MSSVQRDTDTPSEVDSKVRNPSNMLNLKLLISSEQRNSVDECYSPMTGPLLGPLHKDQIDDDENSD